jgi:hypothetical protein
LSARQGRCSANDLGRQRFDINQDNLLLILNAVVGAVSYTTITLGKPRDLTNDKVIFGKSVNGNVGNSARFDIENVEANVGVLGADLGVAQFELVGVNWDILGAILDVVGNAEVANTSLVESQESNLGAVWRVPKRVAVAEDLFLVDPIWHSIWKDVRKMLNSFSDETY